MTTPIDHRREAQKLTADALVDLFEIIIPNQAVVCFTDADTREWQGKLYESWAFKLTTVARNADGERSRPKLTVVNPEGVFNPWIFNGTLEGCTVIRRRVLRQHYETDVAIQEVQMWYISRVMEVVPGQTITFELRSLSDGPDALLPARMFTPPDFPFVTF